MKPAKPYLFGFRMLVVVIIIRLLLIVVAWVLIQRLAGRGFSSATTWISFLSVIVVIIEAMVYWYRRYKIPNKAWVHVHVWTLFVATILIPLATAVMIPVLSKMYSPDLYDNTLSNILTIRHYVYWGLLAIGHIFFIATIVRSLQLKESESNEPPGILDEFVNRP
jgi:hypothetical protein